MTDRVPFDAALWAAALTRPAAASVIIGTVIGLPFGALIGVVLPAMGAPVPVSPELPTWARVALGAPAAWLVVYFQLSKPY
jgi:hypothetical protein